MRRRPARADAVRLGATPVEVRPGGYKVYRGTAAYGDVVLDYPEFGRSEFVPASVALDPETVRQTVGVPFTIIHPDDMLDAGDEAAVKEHDEGTVIRAEANWDANPPELVVDVIVHTASAQRAIESGEVRELSLGYECEEEHREGVHRGRAYQVVQTRRRPNHLSGVHRARSVTPDGRRARLDAADATAARPIAGERRGPAVLPPSRAWASRLDAAALAEAPPDHPALSAPVRPYSPGVVAWRGWSEPDGDAPAWVAFWPRDLAAPGLLFDRREPAGAVLGAPLRLPPRPAGAAATPPRRDALVDSLADAAFAGASYAHLDSHGVRMPDKPLDILDIQLPAADPGDDPGARVDAEPIVEEVALVADPAEALAAFTPEDAEILKTISPEGLTLLAKAMRQVKAEEAEHAAMAAPPGAEIKVEVETPEEKATEKAAEAMGEAKKAAEETDATAPIAPAGMTMDAMAKMLKDMHDQIEALKAGKKADASPPAAAATKPAPTKPAAPAALDVDAIAAQAKKDAAARARLDADFVAAVKKQVGKRHRCDSLADAARAAMSVIAEATPELSDVAAAALKEGRRSEFLALFASAERRRRDSLLDEQAATVATVQTAEAEYLAQNFRNFQIPDSAVSGG